MFAIVDLDGRRWSSDAVNFAAALTLLRTLGTLVPLPHCCRHSLGSAAAAGGVQATRVNSASWPIGDPLVSQPPGGYLESPCGALSEQPVQQTRLTGLQPVQHGVDVKHIRVGDGGEDDDVIVRLVDVESEDH